ncbi:MAG TPA: hypothetical protein VGO52_23490 [Hyphomonadaceae bacterium]|nr:hypothetical protein [Hyphomonadaceae bacterium]
MPKSGQMRPKVKPGVWAGMLVAASVLTAALMATLFRMKIIGMEGQGYFFLLAFVFAMLAMVPYWRSLDEPSREAHKFAVFWGLGWAFAFVMLIGIELMHFGGLRDLVQGWVEGWIAFSKGISGEQQGAVGFYLGIVASTFLMGLAYILVWLGWWAHQRMGAKAD